MEGRSLLPSFYFPGYNSPHSLSRKMDLKNSMILTTAPEPVSRGLQHSRHCSPNSALFPAPGVVACADSTHSAHTADALELWPKPLRCEAGGATFPGQWQSSFASQRANLRETGLLSSFHPLKAVNHFPDADYFTCLFFFLCSTEKMEELENARDYLKGGRKTSHHPASCWCLKFQHLSVCLFGVLLLFFNVKRE